MVTPPDGIDKALEAAIAALEPVVTADGVTQPRDTMEAVMQLARVVDALEELEYQQLVARHESAGGRLLH
jgi:hypothetical protein